MSSRIVAGAILTLTAFTDGCDREPVVAPGVALQTQEPQAAEGEFIGNLYVDGVKSTQGVDVSLIPWTAQTWARLRQPHSTEMWGNPTYSRMWEWYDPKAGGGCGDLAHYLAGDTTARSHEGHWSGPDERDSLAAESHCIRPGAYRFSVADKTFLIDYLPIMPSGPGAGALQVWNSTAGVYETMEDPNPGDTANVWADLVADVDIGSTSYAESRVLSVQNAHDAPDSAWFQDEQTPAGTERDYFRFSVAGSSSTWPMSEGKALTRLYWDYGRTKTAWLTNYYDPFSPSARIIRQHRFRDHVDETRDAVVAMELMRPDEAPDDTLNVTQRTVHVEAGSTPNETPTAGFTIICHQLPCTFTDTSADPDGWIAEWSWTFGDGDSSAQQSPSHTYAHGGTYPVQLIVTDDGGARDTATGWAGPLEIAIGGPATVKPKVYCEWIAVRSGGMSALGFQWIIGGQVVGTEESLVRYTGTSNFTLTLIVADTMQADTASVYVGISSKAPSCVLLGG